MWRAVTWERLQWRKETPWTSDRWHSEIKHSQRRRSTRTGDAGICRKESDDLGGLNQRTNPASTLSPHPPHLRWTLWQTYQPQLSEQEARSVWSLWKWFCSVSGSLGSPLSKLALSLFTPAEPHKVIKSTVHGSPDPEILGSIFPPFPPPLLPPTLNTVLCGMGQGAFTSPKWQMGVWWVQLSLHPSDSSIKCTRSLAQCISSSKVPKAHLGVLLQRLVLIQQVCSKEPRFQIANEAPGVAHEPHFT